MPTPRGARRCSSAMPCRRSAAPQPITRCPRARSGSAHTAGEPTGQTHQLLIVPAVCVGRSWLEASTLAWLNVFMEVHMRIKVYMHMAG